MGKSNLWNHLLRGSRNSENSGRAIQRDKRRINEVAGPRVGQRKSNIRDEYISVIYYLPESSEGLNDMVTTENNHLEPKV